MKIGIHNADNFKYPNLALMKISAYRKSLGDDVEIYQSLFNESYDKVYSSKVFTFTKTDLPKRLTIKGGTGYDFKIKLPDKIEHICPDYEIFNTDYSLGFLTRGCPNSCEWCLVPKKEGNIKPHADIEEFLKHKNVVLMDNNVLASDHGIKQIEKIIKLGVKVDFNQGLDARLIDNSTAKLLSKVKWFKPLRMACDKQSQMKHIQKATQLLRWNNVTPRRYFIYCLIKNVNESIERIKFLKGLDLDPFAQPYRDFENNTEPTKKQKQLARYVNHKAIFKTVTWEEYI